MPSKLKGAQILVECLPGPPIIIAGAGKREGVTSKDIGLCHSPQVVKK